MAGPFVHLAAMEQTRYLIEKHLNIPINAGNKIQVMAPDLTEKHPGWNVLTNKGSLYENLSSLSDKITEIFKATNKDVKSINIPLLSDYIRFICHYIVDSHTMGHLAPDTHDLEFRLEPIGEFVWCKKSLDLCLPSFENFEEFKDSLIKSSRYIYDTYRKPADSWFFLLTKRFRLMIREAVKYGAEYSSALIKLSWDNASK